MKNLHYDEKTAHADTLGQDALFLILRLLCRMSAAALSAAVDAIISQKAASTFRRNPLRSNNHPKRQPLFGREREGGASLREAASLASPR